jgi:hypothetical protein
MKVVVAGSEPATTNGSPIICVFLGDGVEMVDTL